jgi:hypothetical protein
VFDTSFKELVTQFEGPFSSIVCCFGDVFGCYDLLLLLPVSVTFVVAWWMECFCAGMDDFVDGEMWGMEVRMWETWRGDRGGVDAHIPFQDHRLPNPN